MLETLDICGFNFSRFNENDNARFNSVAFMIYRDIAWL